VPRLAGPSRQISPGKVKVTGIIAENPIYFSLIVQFNTLEDPPRFPKLSLGKRTKVE